ATVVRRAQAGLRDPDQRLFASRLRRRALAAAADRHGAAGCGEHRCLRLGERDRSRAACRPRLRLPGRPRHVDGLRFAGAHRRGLPARGRPARGRAGRAAHGAAHRHPGHRGADGRRSAARGGGAAARYGALRAGPGRPGADGPPASRGTLGARGPARLRAERQHRRDRRAVPCQAGRIGRACRTAGILNFAPASPKDPAVPIHPDKLPSRVTVEGDDRAPHRAFLRGLGLSDEDIGKPFVGVASTANNVTPCNAGLGDLAREACTGVREAGGVPFDFASISVADSMSMNHGGMRYSLLSRELIADGVEAVVRGHAYDALVTFAGCDKTLPGMMMAMVRLDLPSVFLYGGAALPGSWRGRDVTVLDTYEGVGALLAGELSAQELDELEHACLPTIGACPGQFTANTMAMISETLGLALPGSATMPAVHSARRAMAREAGRVAMR